MRLIDADALLEKVQFRLPIDNHNAEVISGCVGISRRLIETAPTIDAVPVVRCKDCKFWKKGDFQGGHSIDNMEWGGGCPYGQFARYESDFCSRGERRSDD